MRITTYAEYRITADGLELVAEETHEHTGPVARCGGVAELLLQAPKVPDTSKQEAALKEQEQQAEAARRTERQSLLARVQALQGGRSRSSLLAGTDARRRLG